MKTTITTLLILISLIGYSQIDTIVPDSTPYTKYLIVDESGYLQLNMEISEAKGYDLSDKTERVYPMNPQHQAYNQDSVLMIAVPVIPENQQYIDTSLLVDRTEIMFIDTVMEEITIDKSTQKAYDWFAKHYDKVGDKSKKWFWVDKKIDKEKAPEKIKEKTKVKEQ